MLDIPWLQQSPIVQHFQVVATLPRIMGDFVGSFPGWAKLSLGGVLGSWCDFVQDEISYVQSFELNSFVVVLGHLLLVLCHFAGCSVSRFIQAIQLNSQLIVITAFVENFSSHAGDPYFDWDHYFGAISETDRGLSCQGPRCSPICPQNVG